MPRPTRRTVAALAALLALTVAAERLATLGGARHAVADALHAAGVAARDDGRPRAARARFTWALRVDAGHRRARAAMARLHQDAGRFAAAAAVLAPWLDSGSSTEGPPCGPVGAGALGHLAAVNRFAEGAAGAARALEERAIALARQCDEPRLEAAALVGRARVRYHLAGEVEAARRDLDRALGLARESRDALLEGDALRHLGVVAWWFDGEAGRALDQHYRPALERYRRADDQRGVATTWSNIGRVHATLGDPARALASYRRALALQRRIGDQAGEVDTLRSLAALYAGTGDRAVARRMLVDALARAQALGYRLAANEIEVDLAGHHAVLGEADRAIALLEQVLERERGMPLMASYRLWSMAELARLAGRPRQAAGYLRQARALEPGGAGAEARAAVSRLLVEAEVVRDLGDWRTAEQLLAEARARLGTGTDRGRWHWDTHLVSAEVAAHGGRIEEALALLDQAADGEASWLADAPSGQGPMVRGDRYDRLYALLLAPDSALRSGGGRDGARRADALAFRFLEHARLRALRGQRPASARAEAGAEAARQVPSRAGSGGPGAWGEVQAGYDALQQATVGATLLAERGPASMPRQPSPPPAIFGALDADEALVAYAFAGERVYALVARRGLLVSFPLPGTRAGLRAKIRLLDALLAPVGIGGPEAGAEDRAWEPVAADLWRILIAPLVEGGALDGVERLGIFPADDLFGLPFAVLIDSEGPARRFLVEEVVLSFPPSASARAARADRPPPASAADGVLAVAIGGAVGGLPALPYARAEARAAVAALGGELLLDEHATVPALLARAPSFRALHLAGHALPFPELPLLSALQLAPAEDDDGRLTVAEILSLDLRTELVVLASCRGAASWAPGDERPDERRRFGLIDAWLAAGAEAVVASLLPVDDRSAHRLMTDFYRQLRHRDAAAALAAAQRTMLAGAAAGHHPRHWAPFVLVGRAARGGLSVGTR